jgi:hypothetical protein
MMNSHASKAWPRCALATPTSTMRSPGTRATHAVGSRGCRSGQRAVPSGADFLERLSRFNAGVCARGHALDRAGRRWRATRPTKLASHATVALNRVSDSSSRPRRSPSGLHAHARHRQPPVTAGKELDLVARASPERPEVGHSAGSRRPARLLPGAKASSSHRVRGCADCSDERRYRSQLPRAASSLREQPSAQRRLAK